MSETLLICDIGHVHKPKDVKCPTCEISDAEMLEWCIREEPRFRQDEDYWWIKGWNDNFRYETPREAIKAAMKGVRET